MNLSLLTACVPPPPSGGRTEGVHLSRVIKRIAVENKVLKPEMVEDLDLVEVQTDRTDWWESLPPHVQLRMSMGLAWEEYYGPKLNGVDYHPGELELDGIYMTPDGESIDFIRVLRQDQMVVAGHEFKLTYKSTKRDLRTEWMWLTQMKGYAKALGTRLFFMHILYVCGDYKFPIQPVLRVYRVEFSQLEVDDNWELITSYVDHYKRQEVEQALGDTEC